MSGEIERPVHPFSECLKRVAAAHEQFGFLFPKSGDERVARLFGEGKSKGVPACGAAPDETKLAASVYFRAVAYTLELRTGKRAMCMVEWDAEGFGRALVYAGRLVLVTKAWRPGHFGFAGVEQAYQEGESLVASGTEWLEKYPALIDA